MSSCLAACNVVIPNFLDSIKGMYKYVKAGIFGIVDV